MCVCVCERARACVFGETGERGEGRGDKIDCDQN